jgi:hypothetical protein
MSEKIIDPSIIAFMKQEKIRPKGGEAVTPATARDDFRAGVQKKTNRNMQPSNNVVARPRERIRLSVSVVLRLTPGPPFSP